MPLQKTLLESVEKLSKTDQKKLLEVVKSKIAKDEPLFDSFPGFELKFANFDKGDHISVAKYNLWQAESILWILRVFTDSVGFGFDTFDKDKAFESITFLCEIAISTLSSCKDRIDRAEFEKLDVKDIYVISQAAQLVLLEKNSFEEAAKAIVNLGLGELNTTTLQTYLNFIESLETSGGQENAAN